METRWEEGPVQGGRAQAVSSCRSLGGSESTGEYVRKRDEHQGDTQGFRSEQPEGQSSWSLRAGREEGRILEAREERASRGECDQTHQTVLVARLYGTRKELVTRNLSKGLFGTGHRGSG